MKKVLNVFYLVLLVMVLSVSPKIYAEDVYKIYTVGEKISAQIDDKGHMGEFIVIENSDSKSDEVVVIQQNGGLDEALKALKVKYDSTGNFDPGDNDDLFITDLKVTNAEMRTASTFGYEYTKAGRVVVLAPDLFNGYIRNTNASVTSSSLARKIGVMTETQWNQLDKDALKNSLVGQKYWFEDGAASEDSITFTDNDTYTIDSLNNKFIAHVSGSDVAYTFDNHYTRLIDGNVLKTSLNGEEFSNTKLEPMIYLTLCKKNIVVPTEVNPDTSDMNIIVISILTILLSYTFITSLKKVFVK